MTITFKTKYSIFITLCFVTICMLKTFHENQRHLYSWGICRIGAKWCLSGMRGAKYRLRRLGEDPQQCAHLKEALFSSFFWLEYSLRIASTHPRCHFRREATHRSDRIRSAIGRWPSATPDRPIACSGPPDMVCMRLGTHKHNQFNIKESPLNLCVNIFIYLEEVNILCINIEARTVQKSHVLHHLREVCLKYDVIDK